MTTMINYDGVGLAGSLVDAEPVLFQQTVPRHLVHRTAVSEVFVTDLCLTGENTFQIGAQWPRSHSFFGPRAGSHDPMLLAETIRQSTLAIAHRHFEVPHSTKFVWHETSYHVTREGLRLDGRPADIVLTATAHDIKHRRTGLAGMRLEFDCHRDGRWVGSSGTRYSCVSPGTYTRLRGERNGVVHLSTRMGTPVAAHLVGRDRIADVVLTPTQRNDQWSLRVDRGHPVMFDHPVDHVPGMVTMEATRQAALLALGRTDALVVGSHFNFSHYIELNEPCTAIADQVLITPSAGTGAVQVLFDQGGRTAAEGNLELLVGS